MGFVFGSILSMGMLKSKSKVLLITFFAKKPINTSFSSFLHIRIVLKCFIDVRLFSLINNTFNFKINDESQAKIENNFKGSWSINSNVTITYQTALHRILCDDYTSSAHKHVRVCVHK